MLNSCDVLVQDTTVVTIDPERRVLEHASVAVVDDRIAAVGPVADFEGVRAGRVIDGQGRATLPGFVNAHCHSTHNLMRGGPSDDRVLYDWLVNCLNPAMKAYTAQDSALAAKLYILESLRSGITTTVDNADYARLEYLGHAAVEEYKRSGLRFIYGNSFMDYMPVEWLPYIEAVQAKEPEIVHDEDILEDTAVALERIRRFVKQHHRAADGRLEIWPEPCIALMTTREGLLGAKEIARENGTMLAIHASQSPFDRMQNGMTSVEYLETIGFWGPEVLAAHMVQVEPNDIRILKRYDVKICNNAVSNMFVADGIAPVMEYATAGLTVGIGTDDCNANQSCNMISDLKFAALGQKVKYLNSAAITAEKVLEMATIDGARAVGKADEIGSIEVGKKADLVMINLRHPQTTPCHNVASAIVYHAYGNEVETVLVDGKVLLQDSRPVGISPEEERELLAAVQSASYDVLERAGMQKLRDRRWRSTP